MALEDDRAIRDVLLKVIIDFGQIEPDNAHKLLLQLIDLRESRISQAVFRILSRRPKENALNAAKLALEAASRLGDAEILIAASENSPYGEIRELASSALR